MKLYAVFVDKPLVFHYAMVIPTALVEPAMALLTANPLLCHLGITFVPIHSPTELTGVAAAGLAFCLAGRGRKEISSSGDMIILSAPRSSMLKVVSACEGGMASRGGMAGEGGRVGEDGIVHKSCTASEGGMACEGGMVREGGTAGEVGMACEGGTAQEGGMAREGGTAH